MFIFKVLSASTLIKDEQNKEFPAIEVFAKSILCLKNKLIDELKRKKTLVRTGDILFVLTVPAIWSDNAKEFMRQAANRVSTFNGCKLNSECKLYIFRTCVIITFNY